MKNLINVKLPHFVPSPMCSVEAVEPSCVTCSPSPWRHHCCVLLATQQLCVYMSIKSMAMAKGRAFLWLACLLVGLNSVRSYTTRRRYHFSETTRSSTTTMTTMTTTTSTTTPEPRHSSPHSMLKAKLSSLLVARASTQRPRPQLHVMGRF